MPTPFEDITHAISVAPSLCRSTRALFRLIHVKIAPSLGGSLKMDAANLLASVRGIYIRRVLSYFHRAFTRAQHHTHAHTHHTLFRLYLASCFVVTHV